MKCRINTENKNPKVEKTKKGRIRLLTEFAVCDSKKLKFISQQDARGLLNSLRIKTFLSKIHLAGPLLF